MVVSQIPSVGQEYNSFPRRTTQPVIAKISLVGTESHGLCFFFLNLGGGGCNTNLHTSKNTLSSDVQRYLRLNNTVLLGKRAVLLEKVKNFSSLYPMYSITIHVTHLASYEFFLCCYCYFSS